MLPATRQPDSSEMRRRVMSPDPMCRRSSVNEKRGSNAQEQSERSVKKESGSSVNKKRGRDVR